ncbi:flagellar hook-associated protein FlgK [Savagea sp. SN6]|uniref:Flagellar hook-associated protein 1 n=1 Tax=Savagea serpentis TaxID=2785297 RepID=A0A8J7KEL7_9BACL|nr:flagellar hook-associated protein FlgK [Savagea serpentis]MBF4501296.1 flagellar hook-associated protein FlgK [Savagea serpentis]
MRSTFMGLEASKRGLFTQQSALYTTGHNISNANTPGYSRQRVNMQPTAGYPGIGLNTPQMPGFIGTGVEAGSVQRVRDAFIDKQYRQESNKLGYWESRSKAIEQMEDVLNEPSEFGLQRSMSLFWQSLQDLSRDPENGGARAVAVDRGVAVAESLNYMDSSLKEIQRNLHNEINVSTKEINSILDQIAGLNKQIKEIEPNGYMPNDLYDARDVLIDELSEYMPVEVSYTPSGGKALDIAEGAVTIKIAGSNVELVNGVERVNVEAEYAKVKGNEDVNTHPFNALKVSDKKSIDERFEYDKAGKLTNATFNDFKSGIDYKELPKIGKLKGIIDSYGYVEEKVAIGVEAKLENIKGLYPDHMRQLDQLAREFAKAFNKQHGNGYPKNQAVENKDKDKFEGSKDFFLTKELSEKQQKETGSLKDDDYKNITAGNITVNKLIQDDVSLLRAASENKNDGEEGNGANAKALSDVQHKLLPGLDGSSVQMYFEGMSGELGVKGQQAARNEFNAATMMESVTFRRASVMSVSLDEEMTDMIRFQQAYNASARMMTAVDETLDKIINGMGRVGL